MSNTWTKNHRTSWGVSATLASLLGVAILLPAVAVPASAVSSKTTWTTAKVIQWVDGDTVVTT